MMKKFFLKRCKSFFLIMLIPIMILFCLSTVFIYIGSKDSITQKSANSLSIINDNLDIVLGTSAYQYELLTYNPRLVLSLEKLLRHNTFEYTDVIFLNSVKTSLSAIAQAHSYIDSIYLYLDGYDSYFSSSDGIADLNTTKDEGWYEMYETADLDSRMWIQKREFQEYTYAEPKKYMTMFQRMSNIKGVIVVNINIKNFETVLTNAGSDGNLLFLMDEEGLPLCSNDAGSPIKDSLAEYKDSAFLYSPGPSDPKWVSIEGKSYLLQSLTAGKYGVTFLSLVPFGRIASQLLPTFLVLAGAVISNCVISLLLAYFVTKRNFQQIDDIIQTFDEAEKGNIPKKKETEVNDEYDVILNNVIAVFLNSSYLKHQLAEKQYKQELTEMASLQLQINPHFLFNTLQALDFEALRISGGPSTLNRMIQNLSDILKYSLEDPVKPVLLKNELDYLKKYADIQKQRLGDKFIIYYEIEEDLLDFSVFRLMLQPLVENSLSHGVAPLESTGCIKVRACSRKGWAHFTVIDNGIGLTRPEIKEVYSRILDESSQNIGLTNINRRLLLKYGPESALHIQSKKGMGTCVTFKIPMP